jgi:hypothetical protein
MPTPRTVAQIKANLLRPALTSHFEVKIPKPPGNNFDAYLNENGVKYDQDRLNLLCSEASLPGSSLSTYDIVDDYTGVNEKHVYRRLYDDRIDFSFYVDAENYLPIRFFESWIKYTVNETIATKNNTPGSRDGNFFYRMRYPKDYIANSGLEVTKFERDNKSSLVYNFVNVFPIAITSMPVSYDTASLLKCSVSFSYIRYILNPTGTGGVRGGDGDNTNSTSQNQALTPQQQASLNNVIFNPTAFSTNQLSSVPSVGGVNYSAALASGNTGKGITQFDIANALSAEAALINQNK